MISNGATLQATTTLNVRSGPCTTNSVVKQLTNGQTATYTGQTSSGCGYTWYSISGGWVASNYVNVIGGGGGGGSGKGDIAAKFARQQVGKCYSQAGNLRYGPTCFDCSGLVYMAWKNAGVNIGATWTGAYPGNTRKVSLSEIKTGDILHRDGHVGIYVGNGEVVNAENEKNGVRLRSLSGFRYTTIYRPL